MHKIDFQPIGKRVSVSPGENLLDAARLAGIELTAVCGGAGSCGQCRIRVLEGDVSPPTSGETLIVTELEIQNGERLACCTTPLSDLKIHIPQSSRLTNSRLQTKSSLHSVAVDPLVVGFDITIPPPSLEDPRADMTRIVDALTAITHQEPFFAEPAVIRQISSAARDYEWQFTVYVRGQEIVGIAPYERQPLGIAVDLGTTKIAAFLMNLATGEELAAAGALNPQIGYGEDVISRLNYVSRHADGAAIMAEKLYETLTSLLADLLEQAEALPEQVAECCVVGNTAMIHLLLQLPVRQLAKAPYVSAASAALDVKARTMGLPTAPGAYVHILPGIGGFVGADHIAMILASDMDRAAHVTIGIDVGTNTEIALAKPGAAFMASASCASGPAFEGAHISDGMRAASGAIEAVRLSEAGIHLKTIEQAAPVGMCGSGIVDAVAELRRWQLLNDRGRFQKDNPRLREGPQGYELCLAPADESGSGRDVVITQEDVNEIQLAKGAIRAGLDVLLQVTDTNADDVAEVIVAGAFGSFLNIESALDTGLFPYYPNAVYRQVGNAAAVGAKWALLSRAERERARQIATATNYVELTTSPKFSRLFALGMLFPADDELRIAKE